MISRTSLASLAAKIHKNPFLASLSSLSSPGNHRPEIPARLRHKDWLSPPEAHRVFASLADPAALVPALDHYAARKDYKPTEPLFALVLSRLAHARLFRDTDAVFARATADRNLCRLSDAFFRQAIWALGGAIGRAERAVEILFDMPGKYGAWPSSETFASVLDLLVSARMFDAVCEVFVAAPRLGVEIDSRCLNVMVKGLCECGQLDNAVQVLDEFPQLNCEPDGATFMTLMRHFCARGRIYEAVGLFKRMDREGIEPDTAAFNVLIAGLGKRGRVDEGAALLEAMRLEGCEPDGESYHAVFSGLVAAGRFVKAKELVREAAAKGVIPSFSAYKRLIRGLCREDRMEDVDWVLEEMTRQGFVANLGVWTEILEIMFAGKSNHKCDSFEEIIAN